MSLSATTDYDPPRRYPRLPVSIDCEVDGASGHASLRVSELSLGGCFVDTQVQFLVGAPVTIRASLPGGELVFEGRVLYTQAEYGFGVAFDPLSAPTRARLEEFLGSDRR
jgi:PilZ domain-containing protein